LANDANAIYVNFSESFSIVAQECVYADALTKVFALSREPDHPCLKHFHAQAIEVPA
jgi:FAD:protein FMN transferase